MSSTDSQVTIRDDPGENAYVIEVDGERAGKAEYRIHEGRAVFTHTEVDDAFSGRGLGSRLARFALDDTRRKGMSRTPARGRFLAQMRASTMNSVATFDQTEPSAAHPPRPTAPANPAAIQVKPGPTICWSEITPVSIERPAAQPNRIRIGSAMFCKSAATTGII